MPINTDSEGAATILMQMCQSSGKATEKPPSPHERLKRALEHVVLGEQKTLDAAKTLLMLRYKDAPRPEVEDLEDGVGGHPSRSSWTATVQARGLEGTGRNDGDFGSRDGASGGRSA